MEYLKIQEVAEKWGISVRSVQLMCASGKIEGAMRFGRDWMIPKDAQRPADGRTRLGKSRQDEDKPMLRKTPFLFMSDLFTESGTADAVAQKYAHNYEMQVLLEAEVAYFRGDIDKVYEYANYLFSRHSGFYAVISAGMMFAFCAIWKGDLEMWRRAKIHIAGAPVANDAERDIVSFSITAVDSMLYDVQNFPDWFKKGCFDALHKDALPAASVFYAKYLYATAYAVATKEQLLEGVQGLSLMQIVSLIVEPLISWTHGHKILVAEAYLRLTCASIYRLCGNEEEAVRHVQRAVAIALPDRFYGLLAEYSRTLGTLLEAQVVAVDPAAWEEIKVMAKVCTDGWSRLSGAVRGKTIVTTLTSKQRDVAKLASFGMSNKEIAAKLDMSLAGVKQALLAVSDKLGGVSRDRFAAYL